MKSKIMLSCLLGLILLWLSQIVLAETISEENNISISNHSLNIKGQTETLSLDAIQDRNTGKLASLLPLAAQLSIPTFQDWHHELVDHPNLGVIYRRSLQFDNNNYPHAVYEGEHLYYAWYNGTEWQYITVDDSAGGESPFLLLDHTDHPHISYVHNKSLKYAYWTGSEWNVETIDSGGVNALSSVVLDAANHPHISYVHNKSLKYAYWTGSEWNVETIDSGEVDASTPLALDADGFVHISYYINEDEETPEGYPFAVKYAVQTGTGWDTQIIEQGVSSRTNVTVWGISLALDTEGFPHISYAINPPEPATIKYARWTGSTWDIEIIKQYEDIAPVIAYSSHLVLDTANHPLISYVLKVGGAIHSFSLIYASESNGVWNVQTIEQGMSGLSGIIFILDAADYPHFTYTDALNLYYTRWTGTTWDSHLVGYDSDYFPLALTLDSDEYPHITYYDYDAISDTLSLFYAWPLPPLKLTKNATPMDNLILATPLTYTLRLSGAGRSVQLWDTLPENVEYVPGSVTPSAAVYSPTAKAVLWRGVLSNSEQIVRFQVAPKEIDGTGTLSLSLPIVNTAWLTDTEHNRNVSATVIVNGWHTYLPLAIR